MRISSLLMAASLALFASSKILFWKWSYFEGLGQAVALDFALTLLLGIACAVYLNYRFFSEAPNRVPPARARFVVPAVYDLLLLAILCIPLPPSTEMGAIEFIHGFGDLVRGKGDIPALKAWGQKVRMDPGFEEWEKLPHFIRDYGQPEWIDRAPDKPVQVVWGGGFMHWGFIVTAPGAPPPKSDDYVHIEKLDDELYSLVSIR